MNKTKSHIIEELGIDCQSEFPLFQVNYLDKYDSMVALENTIKKDKKAAMSILKWMEENNLTVIHPEAGDAYCYVVACSTIVNGRPYWDSAIFVNSSDFKADEAIMIKECSVELKERCFKRIVVILNMLN